MNNFPAVHPFPTVPNRSGNAPTVEPFPRSRPIGAERRTGTDYLFDNSNDRSREAGTNHGMFEDLRELDHDTRAAIPDDLLDNLANADVPGAMTEQSLRECLNKTGIRRAAVVPACAPKAPCPAHMAGGNGFGSPR